MAASRKRNVALRQVLLCPMRGPANQPPARAMATPPFPIPLSSPSPQNNTTSHTHLPHSGARARITGKVGGILL